MLANSCRVIAYQVRAIVKTRVVITSALLAGTGNGCLESPLRCIVQKFIPINCYCKEYNGVARMVYVCHLQSACLITYLLALLAYVLNNSLQGIFDSMVINSKNQMSFY